jgi:hypothetical protein
MISGIHQRPLRSSPAARPSITIGTFSPTPAPTESIVIAARPRFVVECQGLHEQEFRAFEFPVLLRGDDRADDASDLHGALLHVPVIDDADDARIGGWRREKMETRLPCRARTRARRRRRRRHRAPTSVRPTGSRDGSTGCNTSSFWPASDLSLMVDTTSPITRAICMI